MSVWADVLFNDVHTFSGPELPDGVRATVGFHSETVHGLTVLAATRIGPEGRRIAWRLDIVSPNESEACFGVDEVNQYAIVVPKVAVRRGDQFCISVI